MYSCDLEEVATNYKRNHYHYDGFPAILKTIVDLENDDAAIPRDVIYFPSVKKVSDN